MFFIIVSSNRAQWKSCRSLFKVWCEVYFNSIKVMFTPNIGLLSRKDACGHALSSVWGRQWLFSFLVKFIANNCLIIIGDAQYNFCHQVHILFLICWHFFTKVQNLIEGYIENGKLVFMKFWRKKHYTRKKNSCKFHLNPVHGFWENDHHHLHPICIFLEIYNAGFSNFWCGDALEW